MGTLLVAATRLCNCSIFLSCASPCAAATSTKAVGASCVSLCARSHACAQNRCDEVHATLGTRLFTLDTGDRTAVARRARRARGAVESRAPTTA